MYGTLCCLKKYRLGDPIAAIGIRTQIAGIFITRCVTSKPRVAGVHIFTPSGLAVVTFNVRNIGPLEDSTWVCFVGDGHLGRCLLSVQEKR